MSDANLGLFENERQTNLESMAAMIEDVLVELGNFINDCRVEVPGAAHAWRIRSGSAEFLMALIDRTDFVHLRSTATVMTMSGQTDRERLFRRLLELNDTTLCGIAFALKGDQVRLVSERSTIDLDRSEVHQLVAQLRDVSDKYDDILVGEFGGKLGGTALL